MSEVLVAFVVGLAIFLMVFQHLTEPNPKSSDTHRISLGILALYIGALWTLWMVPSAWALPTVASAAAIATVALRGVGLAPLTDSLGRYRFLLYMLSVATLSLLVFLFVPITTFLTAPGEIGVHLDYLLSVNARDAMVVVYLAALVYGIAITSRMRTALTLLATGSLALAVVYSYVLPLGYPRMTGLLFEQVPLSPGSGILRMLCDAVIVVATGLGLRSVLIRYGARYPHRRRSYPHLAGWCCRREYPARPRGGCWRPRARRPAARAATAVLKDATQRAHYLPRQVHGLLRRVHCRGPS